MNILYSLTYPKLYEALTELALDLHWSWNHATDKVWRQLDPVLWELTHNPYVVLQTVSHQRINQVLDDSIVRDIIEELLQEKRQRAIAPAWFQQFYPNAPLKTVAYFSMEFMLSEALPIYSGGLGNVTGDHLKSASDLGVPIIGVGLLFQQGYSRQVINKDGSQQYLFPYNDPGQLPITALRTESGEWLRIELKLSGFSLWLRAWKVQVGRVLLLLLDSNDAANIPLHRSITSELYGGGEEQRLAQELVLGIGGCRLLHALGIHPEVLHLNEGHTSFAILEHTYHFMLQSGQPFNVALTATRGGNIFTTHTAVGGGYDCFSPALIEQYLGWYAQERLGISIQELLSLGRVNPDDPYECFNVGYLGIRGSGRVNGVSKVHQKISQQLLTPLFPRWPLEEVPVGSVTNGVHMSTWDSPEADKVWTEACGKNRWLGTINELEQNMVRVPGERLWQARIEAKKNLVEHIRARYLRQLIITDNPQAILEVAAKVFDPEVLTFGFARRFTSYKRPNLLLHDPDRLQRLLVNTEKPVQLIIAGKAHPFDQIGKNLIQQWVEFIQQRELNHKVLFLSDYDMLLTEEMVQGVDVWINTPLSPWEACGTSGMKVLVNGGLNLSVRDGWWDEAYQPGIGWAVSNQFGIKDLAERDAAEAEQLYQILEQEVIPEFYRRDKQGLPIHWINRIRESMARLTPVYSSNRSVRQYTTEYYLPAANAYLERTMNNGTEAKKISGWQQALQNKWHSLHFVKENIEISDGKYIFKVEVYLGDIEPELIKVELYADGKNGDQPFRQEMKKELFIGNGVFSFSAEVPAQRPSDDYTPRLLPRNNSLAIPLECASILWLQ
jgi:starch phosphorylase